jgi:hypothetical protein
LLGDDDARGVADDRVLAEEWRIVGVAGRVPAVVDIVRPADDAHPRQHLRRPLGVTPGSANGTLGAPDEGSGTR